MSADNFLIFLSSGPSDDREYRIGMGYASGDQTWNLIYDCLKATRVYPTFEDAEESLYAMEDSTYVEYGTRFLSTTSAFADLRGCLKSYDEEHDHG